MSARTPHIDTLRAGSREALAAAIQRLDAYAATAEVSQIAQVGDELLAVARLLERELRLRRALADSSREAAQRQELVRNLLTGKVSEPAVDLLQALVEGHWSSPTDLLDATELLGVEALLASAERGGDLADVEDQLFRFGRLVAGQPELAAALRDASVSATQRAQLVRELLEGKARPATVELVIVALHGLGGRNFDTSLARLVELAAARRDRQVAYVTAAAPLSPEEEQQLAESLRRIYGRQVSVQVTIDPRVLGGLSVQVGHDLYDGTVLHRLSQARNALTGRS